MTQEKEALTVFTSLVSVSVRDRLRDEWLHCKSISTYVFFFLSQFGEDHSQTRCSKEFLCTITKQAVKVERSLRQAGAECPEQTPEVLYPQELMWSLIPLASVNLKEKEIVFFC